MRDMIASIFVFFVAAGITMACFVYGFGGLFPLLALLTTVALFFQVAVTLLKRERDAPRMHAAE
jgi:fatty acid desaturase